MFSYVARRILQSIPILLIVLTLVFIVVRVLPGDPAVAALGDYASKEAVNALREKMGLNAPLWRQYLQFIGDIGRGDLGTSIITGYPVAKQVAAVLPHTLLLTISAIILGYLIGVPLGISAAVRRNSFVDYFNRVFSLLGLSVPAFYLGILLILLFSIKIPLFPVVGAGEFSNLKDLLRHLFLPALTLGLLMTAYITRMSRSSILNILGEDYVRTAHAKGVAENRVLYKHVLRNALIPVVALGGALCRGPHRLFGDGGDRLFPAGAGHPAGGGHQAAGLYNPPVGHDNLHGDRGPHQSSDGSDLRACRSPDQV